MGKSFAKKLKGFDVKEVIYYDIITKTPDDFARQVTSEELQAKAEVLSLHTPQTPLTVGMIDTAFFKIFKIAVSFYHIHSLHSVVEEKQCVTDAC